MRIFPHGRRAIQPGLRGPALDALGRREVVEGVDLSDFVAGPPDVLASRGPSALTTPRERVCRPADPAVAARVRLADGG